MSVKKYQVIEDAPVMDIETVRWSELPISRTDLDSQANIVLVGRNVQIISDSSRTVEVSPFIPDYESMRQVLTVDANVRYDDVCTKKAT